MATGTRKTEARRPEPPAGPDLLPLENGDNLTRDEFERRYVAMPHVKKAELIEGVVYMGSPVSHGRPHLQIMTWIGIYVAATPGTDASDNGSVRLDPDNEPQPDAFLFIEASHGGQARVGADDYVEGAPELVVEVASSSASYDLHQKLRVYLRNGVREYVVWRTREGAIDWFALRQGTYRPIPPGEDGVTRSEVFPGLWLDPAALIRGDLARAIAVAQEGTASPEHAAFVEQLRAAAGPNPEGPRP